MEHKITKEEFRKVMDTWDEHKNKSQQFKSGLATGIGGGIELKRARERNKTGDAGNVDNDARIRSKPKSKLLFGFKPIRFA